MGRQRFYNPQHDGLDAARGFTLAAPLGLLGWLIILGLVAILWLAG